MITTLKIKKVLREELEGTKTIKVRQGRGTACEWVTVTIILPKPSFPIAKDGYYSTQALEKMDKVRHQAYQIIKNHNLLSEVGKREDEMGRTYHTLNINTEFEN